MTENSLMYTNMCFISGGNWNNTSNAGMWNPNLNNNFGLRCDGDSRPILAHSRADAVGLRGVPVFVRLHLYLALAALVEPRLAWGLLTTLFWFLLMISLCSSKSRR